MFQPEEQAKDSSEEEEDINDPHLVCTDDKPFFAALCPNEESFPFFQVSDLTFTGTVFIQPQQQQKDFEIRTADGRVFSTIDAQLKDLAEEWPRMRNVVDDGYPAEIVLTEEVLEDLNWYPSMKPENSEEGLPKDCQSENTEKCKESSLNDETMDQDFRGCDIPMKEADLSPTASRSVDFYLR